MNYENEVQEAMNPVAFPFDWSSEMPREVTGENQRRFHDLALGGRILEEFSFDGRAYTFYVTGAVVASGAFADFVGYELDLTEVPHEFGTLVCRMNLTLSTVELLATDLLEPQDVVVADLNYAEAAGWTIAPREVLHRGFCPIPVGSTYESTSNRKPHEIFFDTREGDWRLIGCDTNFTCVPQSGVNTTGRHNIGQVRRNIVMIRIGFNLTTASSGRSIFTIPQQFASPSWVAFASASIGVHASANNQTITFSSNSSITANSGIAGSYFLLQPPPYRADYDRYYWERVS